MRVRMIGMALTGVVLSAGAALAGPGQAGLWEVSTQMNMPGMDQMPDISQLPPEVQARMQAMQITTNGGAVKARHCVTEEDVKRNSMPKMDANRDCEMRNVKALGKNFSADMVCTGEFKGTGQMKMTYKSDRHYQGQMRMQGTAQGRPINMTQNFEGRWISASCPK